MNPRHTFATSFGLVAGLCLCGSALCAEAVPSLNPLKAIDKATLKGFLERPLFDPARQLPPVVPPQPVVVAQPVAAPPEPPPLHLLGVIQGARTMAIVRRDGEEKTMILRTGDHVGDWRVVVLPSAGIKLENGSRSVDYAMFKTAGTTSSAVARDDTSGQSMGFSEAMAARNARLSRRTY